MKAASSTEQLVGKGSPCTASCDTPPLSLLPKSTGVLFEDTLKVHKK